VTTPTVAPEQTTQTPAVRRGLASQLPLAFVAALVGFLIVTQFQAREGLNTRLAGEREADLAQILSDLSVSGDQVRDEIVDLRVRLQAARGSAEQEKVLVDTARQQLDALRILLGLVPAKGPGVVVTVTDPDGTVGPDVLLDAIEEMRDAGAEAIQVNEVRIVASSAFGGSPGAITVSGQHVTAPYTITAIGGAETLDQALRIPGGVVDTITGRQSAAIVIEKKTSVRIASLRPAPRFTYASPS
jgi:uncharacterized protein YlxW (UPF0749 family)